MKKNIAMRVAAFLFILTMISTCAFATTFAKYVTSGTATDEARVAKWGVTVSVTGDDAFKTDYAKDDVNYSGTYSVSAVSTSRDNLLAPGTNGNLLSVSIEGTPEVATEVKVEFTFDLGENWVADGYYCPLVITVGTTDIIKGNDFASVDEFEAAVIAAVLAKCKNDDAAGSAGVYTYDVNDTIDAGVNVTWAWAFEGNDDAKDTILGSATAVPTITFGITVTVTQID